LSGTLSFAVSATQAYNFYRLVITQLSSTNVNGVNFSEWTLNGTEESLCVTSDAKVGVGIANPQRALEVAGDLVVSGTISGGAGMGSFRNRIINGDMRIAQRGTSGTITGPTSAYTQTYLVDRFNVQTTLTTGTITQTQQTLTASDTPYQLGFSNSMRVTTTVPCTSYSLITPLHQIEGYTISDFKWGTSFGSPVTISFWFRSNAPTGSVFSSSMTNYGYGNMSYIYPFTLIQSGSWQYVTYTAPPPPNGSTWLTGNNGCLGVYVGCSFPGVPTSTVNAWNSTSYGYSAQYNWPLYAGNYVEVTGVQLEKGTVATGFEQRPFATELALCQRYYETGTSSVVFTVSGGAQTTSSSVFYKVTKRSATTPVLTGQAYYNSSGGGQAGTPSFYTTSTDSFNIQLNTNAATWGQLVWNTPSEL